MSDHRGRSPIGVQWTLTFDCARPSAQAAFWCLALGYVEAAPPKGFSSWEEWIHPDIQAGGGRSEPWEVRWPKAADMVQRLTAAGASVIHEDIVDGRPDHVVMADPEGNEFCVL